MMLVTLKKFGYPETLVKEYKHWRVLVRPKQVTLGSLILICREGVNNWSDISSKAFCELNQIIPEIETKIKELFSYEKINYLMLMMVDPEVHFHVIPRYSESKEFAGTVFKDAGWPVAPELDKVNEVNQEIFNKLTRLLKEKFNA
ncbi:MAG: HIT family protein [Patescibacteria group bacterium]